MICGLAENRLNGYRRAGPPWSESRDGFSDSGRGQRLQGVVHRHTGWRIGKLSDQQVEQQTCNAEHDPEKKHNRNQGLGQHHGPPRSSRMFCVLRSQSIRNAIAFFLPFAKCGEGLFAPETDARDAALAGFAREVLIKHFVEKPGLGGVGPAGRVINALDAGPIGGTQAHWTRLATRVKLGAFEEKRAGCSACLADRDDFGVRGWVIGGSHLVPAAADDLAVAHDNGAKWPAFASAHHFDGKANRLLHERFAMRWYVGHLSMGPCCAKPRKSVTASRATCSEPSKSSVTRI